MRPPVSNKRKAMLQLNMAKNDALVPGAKPIVPKRTRDLVSDAANNK